MSDVSEPGAPKAPDAGVESDAPARPVLRIVDASATPEEVAAIVAVFSALGSPAAAPPKPRRGEWSALRRNLRPALHAGPGAWRSSGLPG